MWAGMVGAGVTTSVAGSSRESRTGNSRRGQVSPAPPLSGVWVQCPDDVSDETLKPFIENLQASLPRLPVLIITTEGRHRRLAGTFPTLRKAVGPIGDHHALSSAIAELRPRAIVQFGDQERTGILVQVARDWGVPLLVVKRRAGTVSILLGVSPVTPGDHSLGTLFIAAVWRRLKLRRSEKTPDPNWTRIGEVPNYGDAGSRVAEAIVAFHRDSAGHRNDHHGGVRGHLRKLPAVHALAYFNTKQYQTLYALKDRLKSPQTIACLGSGPSSEDPLLLRQTFDVLFRVNLRWLNRGILDDPDVIFTWRPEALTARPKSILAFSTSEKVLKGLIRRYPFQVIGRQTEIICLSDLPLQLHHVSQRWHPSNGVYMLEVAVALSPRRLIIAGFDLFMHEAGAYPGDSTTLNAFALVHDRDAEVNYIAQLLDFYEGEIVVIGDILRDRLAAKGIDLLDPA
jgi:hypothetical protein